MASVKAKKGEHPEALIRRFQREVEYAGIMKEVRRRRYFMSKSEKRKEKQKTAAKRRKKEMQRS